MKKQIWWTLPAMLSASLLVAACTSHAEETPKPKIISVETQQAQQGAATPGIRTAGRLAAKAEAQLSFKIGGILQQIAVDEGAVVRKGQLLARLNSREIDAQVAAAVSAAEKAARDLQRAEKLYADSVATLEQVQNARTAGEVALARQEIARFNQHYAAIYAPADGRILKRFSEVNELLSPGMPVFTFSAENAAWVVRCGVADRDVVKLRIGDTAELRFDPYPATLFPAEIVEIAESADPYTGTYELELQIENPPQRLISGFVARVDIRPASSQSLIIIPAESLVEGDGTKGYVYIAEGDIARRREVTIAAILPEGVGISDGPPADSRFITAGSAYLSDGAAIRVINPNHNPLSYNRTDR